MNFKYLILVSISFLFFACNKADDLFDVMPESDLIAIDGMEVAYDSALRYNDSLLLCSTEPGSCDSVTMFHYDDIFHHNDSLFILHHENYSHNNMGDEHHHEGGSIVHHGGMMHHDDHDDGHDKYEHNDATFDMMKELREMHEGIHPQ
ncbi:MAG: hypothetical protein ACI8P3_003433 [Saprospiraceae bacterium]|jgi:hypothetical protein